MMNIHFKPVAQTLCALFVASALGACASMRGGGSGSSSSPSDKQASSGSGTSDTMSGATGSGDTSSSQGATASTGASQSKPNDAEVAHIVSTANTVDITAGQMALEKSKNPEVKQFAKEMVNDHKSVNQQVAQLTKKLGVDMKSNDTSKSLISNGDAHITEMRKLWGDKFDRAYVDNEVQYHQQVLNTIDNTLMPNAQNPELKSLLQKVRPNIQAHLDHAKHLQSTLMAKSGSSRTGETQSGGTQPSDSQSGSTKGGDTGEWDGSGSK